MTSEPLTGATLTVRCACGWETSGTEAEVVATTIDHGRRLHNMEATPEQVLAMAVPRDDARRRTPRRRPRGGLTARPAAAPRRARSMLAVRHTHQPWQEPPMPDLPDLIPLDVAQAHVLDGVVAAPG